MRNELRARVLLADNHPGILIALKRMLAPSFEVVGSVTDGAALLDVTRTLEPDVVVLDVSMPHMDGLDACKQIKETIPRTKVVILTAANDTDIEELAFRMGASAFVLKYQMANDLPSAIQKVMSGDTPFSPSKGQAA